MHGNNYFYNGTTLSQAKPAPINKVAVKATVSRNTLNVRYGNRLRGFVEKPMLILIRSR